MTNTVHEGRNIKRIREMLGVKQDTLANDLGWNQQKVSLLEQKERIEPQLLEEVAKALKVPVEAMEENKKLYERLLQVQKEKIEILQSLLDERK